MIIVSSYECYINLFQNVTYNIIQTLTWIYKRRDEFTFFYMSSTLVIIQKTAVNINRAWGKYQHVRVWHWFLNVYEVYVCSFVFMYVCRRTSKGFILNSFLSVLWISNVFLIILTYRYRLYIRPLSKKSKTLYIRFLFLNTFETHDLPFVSWDVCHAVDERHVDIFIPIATLK